MIRNQRSKITHLHRLEESSVVVGERSEHVTRRESERAQTMQDGLLEAAHLEEIKDQRLEIGDQRLKIKDQFSIQRKIFVQL